ncbi:MAG: dehydrogenase [Nitrospinae bacterium]|nr:dehydrogenase [Nitrospinota bacterium]
MTKVYNRQLRREMDYSYDSARPKRQIAYIFDINRCIGCQTCTIACKSTWTFGKGQEYMWWNNVESKPFGSYPQHWDIKLLAMLGPQQWDKGVYAGKTIFESAPEDEKYLGFRVKEQEWRFPNMYEDTATGHDMQGVDAAKKHGVWFHYLQRICNHCTYPACLAACPRKAIYKRDEDGIVLIDQSRCRGYRECVGACPYKKSMYRPESRTSEKCIACFPRVEKGEMPRCVVACVGKIRLQGYLTTDPRRADPNNPIDYLVHFEKVALPLYPQFGTEPNVYYLPPRWVPLEYLGQLFGPGVEEAIAKRTDPSDKLFACLRCFGMQRDVLYRFELQNGRVLAYNDKDEKVIDLALKDEPFYERPMVDKERNTLRINEP